MSRQILWGLLALGALAAGVVLWGRHERELGNRAIEPVADYASVVEYARASGNSTEETMKFFEGYGVRSYALAEVRLDDLQSDGTAVPFEGLQFQLMLSAPHLGVSPEDLASIDPHKLYLVFFKPAYLDRVELGLKQALAASSEEVKPEQNKGRVARWSLKSGKALPWPVLEVDSDLRSLQPLGLGFSPDLVQSLAGKGYCLWLRAENKPVCGDPAVAKIFDGFKQLAAAANATAPNATPPGPISGVIFGGAVNEALGYPDAINTTCDRLKELGWKVGIIELDPRAQQKGIEELVRLMPDSTARVFAVAPAQQQKLKPQQLVGMYSLGARERNMRVLYLRPFPYDPSPEKEYLTANQDLLADIQKALGSEYGKPASTFREDSKPNPVLLSLVALGAAAASWLLLEFLRPIPLLLGAALLAGLPVLTALTCFVGVGPGHHWRSLMALGTACAVSTLSMVCHFDQIKEVGNRSGRWEVWWGSSLLLLRMSLLTLVGALMAASYLGETSYLLGLDVFRGVKLVTLGVPVLVVGFWLYREGTLLPGLTAQLRLYHVVGLAVLAVAGVIYWLRTGNMSGDVGGDALEYEKTLRLLLDQTIGVRPRFKEFVLGHPAMMLCPAMIWLGRREWVWLTLLAGAVGQVGLADTFGHTHTPLTISLTRTALGLGLGWLVGSGLMAVVLRLPRKS